jgi:hypothetical protein
MGHAISGTALTVVRIQGSTFHRRNTIMPMKKKATKKKAAKKK